MKIGDHTFRKTSEEERSKFNIGPSSLYWICQECEIIIFENDDGEFWTSLACSERQELIGSIGCRERIIREIIE